MMPLLGRAHKNPPRNGSLWPFFLVKETQVDGPGDQEQKVAELPQHEHLNDELSC